MVYRHARNLLSHVSKINIVPWGSSYNTSCRELYTFAILVICLVCLRFFAI